MCNFVFLFATSIVNSFNFISNVICFGTEWKGWFEMHEEVFSGGFVWILPVGDICILKSRSDRDLMLSGCSILN